MLPMADGRLWRPAKNLPYKHSAAAYDGNMTGIIGFAAYGSQHKISHAIMA